MDGPHDRPHSVEVGAGPGCSRFQVVSHHANHSGMSTYSYDLRRPSPESSTFEFPQSSDVRLPVAAHDETVPNRKCVITLTTPSARGQVCEQCVWRQQVLRRNVG